MRGVVLSLDVGRNGVGAAGNYHIESVAVIVHPLVLGAVLFVERVLGEPGIHSHFHSLHLCVGVANVVVGAVQRAGVCAVGAQLVEVKAVRVVKPVLAHSVVVR